MAESLYCAAVLKSPWLTAIAGMPCRAAHSAAPTVPERLTSWPTFWPKLMPETTRSGGCGRASSTPYSTESAGNPATAVAGKAPAVDDGVTLKGVVVRLSPVPLWLAAGAITVTSRLGFPAICWSRASMPGAPTPSSLVTRTRNGAGGAAEAVTPDVASSAMASRAGVRIGMLSRTRPQARKANRACGVRQRSLLTATRRDHILVTMSSRGRRMAAGGFKAQCLAVLDDVELSGREVVITKRGRPVAKVVPVRPAPVVPIPDLIVHQDDLVSPIEVEWDADR